MREAVVRPGWVCKERPASAGRWPLDYAEHVHPHRPRRDVHPGNIGAVARAMKTMGLEDLWLVAPRQFPADEATARAAGADDVLAGRAWCRTCAARSPIAAGRRHHRAGPALALAHRRPRAAREIGAAARQAGSRSCSGRSGPDSRTTSCARCQLLTIPAGPAYASLNLAMAVQVLCYEFCLALRDRAGPTATPQVPLATALDWSTSTRTSRR